jgi:hypothetical protein
MLTAIQFRIFCYLLCSKKIKIIIYKSLILSVVLYWCETWSLILREDHRLRGFEKRLLRRIFGPKRNEVTGGWRNVIIRSFTDYTLQ